MLLHDKINKLIKNKAEKYAESAMTAAMTSILKDSESVFKYRK